MLLPFKIKLKKDCNKNAYVVHLCSISEVVKPNSKITYYIQKQRRRAHANKITYTLLWQYFNTYKFKRNVAIYCLLLYSNLQGHFKIGRALPQLYKNCEIFYRSNSRWPAAFLSTEKSQLQVWCYKNSSCLGQSEVPVQR